MDTSSNSQSPQRSGIEALLTRLLLNGQTAVAAAKSLREGAEVALTVVGADGDWRFFADQGKTGLEPSRAADPDFELHMTSAALERLAAMPDGDLADFGIEFFERIVSKDPQNRIRVVIHSGLIKLTRRGWVGLLSRGGPKLAMWMGRKGLKGPGAVITALARLKSPL
jgi:hypothetical protein